MMVLFSILGGGILMAIIARMAGGGLGAPRLPGFLPEVIFGMPFGIVLYLSHPEGFYIFNFHVSPYALGVVGWLWSYAWMETGHGNAFHDGVARYDFPDRHQRLDYVVRPFLAAVTWLGARVGLKLDLAPRSTWYCRTFMALKGLLIGLPAFPFGLTIAILWPLAYAACFRTQTNLPTMQKSSATAELMSGNFAGIVVAVAVLALIGGLHG